MIFLNEIENRNLSGIYKITQISTGKAYIGQTKMKFIKRFWHHSWKLRNGSHDNIHLQKAWEKYGENDFQFEALHILDKNECMDDYEIMYIDKYNTYNNGFNMTIGGEGKKLCPMSDNAKRVVGEKNKKHMLGKKHSKETRQKMRESSPHRKLTEEHKENLRKCRIGSKMSEESRLKMREKKIGSKCPNAIINEEIAYKIKVKLMNGEKIKDIAVEFGINRENVSSILNRVVWNHVYVDGWDEFANEYDKNKKKSITDDIVREIRELLKQGYSASKIADIYKIKENVVYGIKQNRNYKHVN